MFIRVKIHDSTSVSTGLLLSSSRVFKNTRPNIQVPHNTGCNDTMAHSTILKIIDMPDNYIHIHASPIIETMYIRSYVAILNY